MAKDIVKEEYVNHERLTERRKFSMMDLSRNGNDVNIEVNWNKFASKQGCIKFSINDEEAVISREHLYAILFMLGSAEEQQKMSAPFLKQTQVTKYFKLLGVTATKDVRKGEMLNVPLEFTLNPETHQVVIVKSSMGVIDKAIMREKVKSKKII